MINGKIAGMDSFGKPDSFSKIFKKLVESYALDAVDRFEPEKEHDAPKSAVTDFMKAARTAQIENCPSVGPGTDLRVESKKITGFTLLVDDQILHLCIFTRINGQGRKNHPSRMERYSRRRRNRVY